MLFILSQKIVYTYGFIEAVIASYETLNGAFYTMSLQVQGCVLCGAVSKLKGIKKIYWVQGKKLT